MLGEVGIESGLKLSHGRKASPSDGLSGDPSKETLDHVEPGTASGSEVKMTARMASQPAMHGGGFMGGVVVNDEVKLSVAVLGDCGVDAV